MEKENFENYSVEAATTVCGFKCSNGSLTQAVKKIEKIVGVVDIDKQLTKLHSEERVTFTATPLLLFHHSRRE